MEQNFKLYSVAEVSALTGIPRSTIYQMIKTGTMPVLRAPHMSLRIRAVDLVAFMETRTGHDWLDEVTVVEVENGERQAVS